MVTKTGMRNGYAWARLGALLALVATPGCFWATSKREGAKMRADIEKLNSQLAVQDESVEEKVRRLDASLDKATKLLTRNSADLGAEMQQLSEEIAKLTGKVNDAVRQAETVKADLERLKTMYEERQLELNQRLAEMGKKTVEDKPQAPVDKDGLFADANQKMQAEDYVDARKSLFEFQKKFAADARADNALFLIGESYAKEKNYEKAIAGYQRLIDQYPDGDMADDAFFAAGKAAEAMKWCTDARAYYGVLVRRFPKSNFVKEAQEKLRLLKRDAKNKKICQS